MEYLVQFDGRVIMGMGETSPRVMKVIVPIFTCQEHLDDYIIKTISKCWERVSNVTYTKVSI